MSQSVDLSLVSSSPAPPWKEPPVNDVLTNLLNDEGLADISLESTDGVVVKANRCILAARSDVFRKMLFGGFLESSSPTIDVRFDGAILKAAVQYIYTGSGVHVLGDLESPEVYTQELAFQLVSLVSAASFYNLIGLLKESGRAAERIMKEKPELSLVFYENCGAVDRQSSILKTVALHFIRQNPNLVFTENVTRTLSAATLEAVAKDGKLNMNELGLFHLIQRWADGMGTDSNPNSEAIRLMRYVRFELISPKELSTTISDSPLVTRDQLYEAYKAQALQAMAQNSNLYSAPRFACRPQWVHIKDSIFKVDVTDSATVRRTLSHPGMKSGVHQWTIKVLEKPPDISISLGVQSNCTDDQIVWRYSDAGSLYQKNIKTGSRKRRYAAGDEVTFDLNLEKNNGCLKASVNGGEMVTLFENMISFSSSDGQQSLVPMARLRAGASVKVLSLREVRRDDVDS